MPEPAFPVNELHDRSSAVAVQHFGLTDLDVFALQAMQGFLASGRVNLDLTPRRAQELAENSYLLAEYMLQARITPKHNKEFR